MIHRPSPLLRTEHRPYALPEGPWHWAQSWKDLAFLHWPIDADRIRDHIPIELEIDEHDGTAWIGVVPFHLVLRLRLTPPIPRVSIFPEINVRTYVTHQGKPGVWFFSLDARSVLAVLAARWLFALPYYRATMGIRAVGDHYSYRSLRSGGHAEFRGDYRPVGDIFVATPGALEHFLTERYCLYAQNRAQTLHRSDIHHVPWPLQAAESSVEVNTMVSPLGLELGEKEPLVHFVKRIDALVWPLRRV